MTTIIFEGVRCFHDRHLCPIKPMTLLVGENSSGKTTFLAMCRIAWDIAHGELDEDIFNEEPFLLGSYDQLASYRGGKAGRARSFVVGIELPIALGERDFFGKREMNDVFGPKAKITARFNSRGASSGLAAWEFECGEFRMSMKPTTDEEQWEISATNLAGHGELKSNISFPRRMMNITLPRFYHLISRESRIRAASEARMSKSVDASYMQVNAISRQVEDALGPRPYAFAPIRSKPLRTYDPLKEVPKPEGSHMPMVLAKTLLDKSNGNLKLRRALSSFGDASGLYANVEVKRKGNKESDPFQIGVKSGGPMFNLVDVGYGISQVLPIVVDAAQNPAHSNFLLQQPEVHLHPKAQAELGSFLATIAKNENKRFVIETHSDHLIDRIRMDVRDKKNLRSSDVSILYFERSKSGVTIHPLEIDDDGNLVNAPPSYRQFFLEEERRMLGV